MAGLLEQFRGFLEDSLKDQIEGVRVFKSDKLTICNKSKKQLGRCRVNFEQGAYAVLWSLDTDDNCRKKRAPLGRLTTQAVARFAQTLGVESVEIKMVEGDGLSFWPYMGAEPAAGFSQLGVSMTRIIRSGMISQQEKQKLQQAFNRLNEGQDTAWFSLTDKTMPDSCIKKETMVLLNGLLSRDMFFDLTRPVVHSRLGLNAPQIASL